MSKKLNRDSAIDKSDCDSEVCETMVKSTTLLSEDSGVGLAFLPSPDNEEKSFTKKENEKETKILLNGQKNDLNNFSKMTRSFGIHSGLSDHLNDEKEKIDDEILLNDSKKDNDSKSPFEKGLIEAMKLKNPHQLNTSSTFNSSLTPSQFTQAFSHKQESSTNISNKENLSEKFTRGLRCNDVETAMKILNTHYICEEINLKRTKSRFATSCYPVLVNNFLANPHWNAVEVETKASKSLREIREEIDKKDKELAELTRLILKRQQDLEDEQQKMLDRKRIKIEDEKTKKVVNIVENSEKTTKNSQSKKDIKNPFRRAIHSVRKKLKRAN